MTYDEYFFKVKMCDDPMRISSLEGHKIFSKVEHEITA